MIGRTVQAIMATLQHGFPKVLGVPVNDDGGEQVQPGHAEVLALGCSITDFPLAANAQRILEGVMCFALVQADLGAVNGRVKVGQRWSAPLKLSSPRGALHAFGENTSSIHSVMHKIGEDRSERLDIVPAQLRVIVTVRPKYACRSCTDGVTQAPARPHLIMGGLPTEATLAHVGV